MNIFPSSFYKFKTKDDETTTIERLKRRTEHSNRLVTKLTEKSFIGIVEDNSFRLISSSIGKGAFCTLRGKFNNRNGEVVIEINKPFKFLISILLLLPIVQLIVISITEEFKPILILVALFEIVIIRFVLVEILYKKSSKQSINRLSDVIDANELKKQKDQQITWD